MSAPTEDFTRIANNSRDAVTAAVNAWAEAAKRYATQFDVQNPVPAAAVLKDRRTCAVAEKDARIAIGPIRD